MLKKKLAVLALLITLCLTFAIFFQLQGIGTVYSHLFYLPIILSCIWWPNKSTVIALTLGISLLVIHARIRPQASFINDSLRGLIFILIAIPIGKLSILQKKYRQTLKIKTKETEVLLVKQKNISETLDRQNKELKEAKQKTEEKTKKLKKLYELTVGREIKMVDLKMKSKK